MRRSIVPCMALLLGLMGCVPAPKIIMLKSQFDLEQHTRLLQPGTNKITGSALIRQQGGGVVSCAGLAVSLIPATEYATERVIHLYGSNQKGFRSTTDALPPTGSPIKFEPDDPDYTKSRPSVICDALGMFEFDDIADGAFYVVTSIVWSAGQYGNQQGGSLMQHVVLAGGETKRIVLSP